MLIPNVLPYRAMLFHLILTPICSLLSFFFASMRYFSREAVTLKLLFGWFRHKRNFVVKCEGAAWRETNILRNRQRSILGNGILYPHCLKKWGGRVPLVPHLIAPMEGKLLLKSA